MSSKTASKSVLVIGGSGFIGSRLCPLLAEAGHKVTIFDKSLPEDRHSAMSYIQGDVRTPADLEKALSGIDCIYNLAAEHQDNVRPLSLYTDVNVTGASNIAKAADKAGIRHIIFTSSVAIYGSQDQAMDEDAPHNFFNEYGRTKHLAEIEFRAWQDIHPENKLTIIRPTVVFGVGNRGNVYNLLRQIKHGPFIMFGDGRNVKSVAHVDNIALFLAQCLNEENRYAVYNYSDKPDLNMRDFVLAVDKALGRKEKHRIGFPKVIGLAGGYTLDIIGKLTRRTFPVSAIRVQKFCSMSEIDSSKAMQTGFTPQRTIEDGIREILAQDI